MTKTNRHCLGVLSLCLTAALVAAQPTRAESDNHVHGAGTQRVPGTDMDQNGRPMPPLHIPHVYAPGVDTVQDVRVIPPPTYVPPHHVQAAPPVYVPPRGHVAYRPALNERQVEHLLQRQGFHRIRDIDFSDGRYIAQARDGYGRPVRVAVSAHTGEILNVRYR